MKKICSLLLIVLVFSSCTLYRVNSKDITKDYYPAKNSIQDVVYIEKIDKPHEVIGFVIVNAERRQNISAILKNMRREAAILGGDAITEIKSDATGTWKKLPAQELIGNAYVRANFTATVVVYK